MRPRSSCELRGLGISDRAVLKAIETVPRTLFVPKELQRHAYSDQRAADRLRADDHARPRWSALMTVALDVCDRHSVLEIGTGSGYQTAMLARLARRVTTIERFRTLVHAGGAALAALGIRNISAVVADGTLGWRRQAPFDRILVTAACADAAGQAHRAAHRQRHPDRADRRRRAGRSGSRSSSASARRSTRAISAPARFLPIVPGVAQNL